MEWQGQLHIRKLPKQRGQEQWNRDKAMRQRPDTAGTAGTGRQDKLAKQGERQNGGDNRERHQRLQAAFATAVLRG